MLCEQLQIGMNLKFHKNNIKLILITFSSCEYLLNTSLTTYHFLGVEEMK